MIVLNNFFGLDKVCVHDVADDAVILDVLVFYLEKVFRYVNQKSMTNAEISEILLENFTKRKALSLFQFHKAMYNDDEMKNMYQNGGMNRSTIYRYKKDLKRVGIGFSESELPQGKGILEQLIIPSESSKFDLIGQQGILPL